jgi:plastocyanin
MRRPGILLVSLAALGGSWGSQDSPAPKAGGVKGRLSIAIEGVWFDQLGPIVVYLDAREGSLSFVPPTEVPVVSQKDVRFTPAFLVITAGQTVNLANDDRIVHNVFSYSPPKRFDLGLYPKGESRLVRFDTPGVIDLFCSIHVKMNATIFAAPSPYHCVAGPGGEFEITGVPSGLYRLRSWSRKLPAADRLIEVTPAACTTADLEIPRSK